MKSVITIGLLGFGGFLVGCSKNQITIENMAGAPIYFVFRGDIDTVVSGARIIIDEDIPNGTFEYGTTYGIPSNAAKWSAGGNLSGSVSFTRDRTEYSFLYASTFFDGEYIVNLNITSTESKTANAVAP